MYRLNDVPKRYFTCTEVVLQITRTEIDLICTEVVMYRNCPPLCTETVMYRKRRNPCRIIYAINFFLHFYHISRQRLYLNVGKFKNFNRSLYDFLDSSGISLVALFCTRSILSTSVFLFGYQTLLAYSK